MINYKYIFQKIEFIFICLLTFLISSCQKNAQIQSSDNQIVSFPSFDFFDNKAVSANELVLSVGNSSIYSDKYKLMLSNYILTDSMTSEQVLNEIIANQLLIEEGTALGYDKEPNLLAELETFTSVLSKQYLVDSTQIKNLAEEAYTNLQSEVEVAHLLVYLPETATPEQKTNALQKVGKISTELASGETFENLTQKYSDDKKTASIGGYMGWFSGLQLIYDLEKTAFSLQIGEISKPVKTKYGYHFVKLVNKRASQGRVIVQHILKSIPLGADSIFISKQKNTIDSLYTILTPSNFDAICKNNSDDFITKNSGGELPEFWIGSREEKIFEETAFALKEGEISKPIRTSSGWHIIKLKKHLPLPTYKQLKNELYRKVTTDSRGEFINQHWNETIKQKLGFKPNLSIIAYCKNLGTADLLKGQWKIPYGDSIIETFLFSIDGISVSVKEFFTFVSEQQAIVKTDPTTTPSIIMEQLYEKFEKKKIKEFGEKNTVKLNSELQFIVESYKNKVIKSTLLNERVFEKSITDTLAQKNYYKQHLNLYKFPERALVFSAISTDSTKLSQFKQIKSEGEPYRLRRGIQPIFFTKNSNELSATDKERLIGLATYLNKKADYFVEIGGHSDVAESQTISQARIQAITDFLIERNVSITQIREFDYGISKLADKFDWTKNQRVSFQFFSTNIKDVEKTLSTESSKLTIDEFYLAKTELKNYNGINWEVGVYTGFQDGAYRYISIEKIEEARNKSFSEAKVQVIKDYQKELESQFFKELKSKYPVKINKTIAKELFEEAKKLQLGN